MAEAGPCPRAVVTREGDQTLVALPASLECVDQAADAFRQVIGPLTGSRRLFEATMALREALLNAVVHGCGSDPEVTVRLRFRIETRSVVMEVHDPGPGFDWRKEFLKSSECTTPGGRGLCIMNLYCDEVAYNGAGNQVRLTAGLDQQKDSPMKESEGKTPIISPGGSIVASMAQDFRTLLKQAADSNPDGFAIDLREVEQIDSVGLGVLIAAHNSLAKSGGKLALVNASDDILRLLRAMRLDKHFLVNQ